MAHPRSSVRDSVTRRAAGRLSAAQRPFISGAEEKEYLEACESLERVGVEEETSRLDGNGGRREKETCEGSKEQRKAKVQRLEAQRQHLAVAWITGRHIDGVRAWNAQDHLATYPRRNSQTFVDGGQFLWGKWLGYLLLYYTQDFSAQYIDEDADRHGEDATLDVDSLVRVVERFIVVTAPWQAWWMSVKDVYQWRDAKRTGRWLALYAGLWYMDHVVGFLYAYIIFAVLRNRYQPDTLGHARDSFQTAIDRGAKARHWGELVDKHGRDEWIDPLLDDLGPWLQLQLGDLTDLLEIISNFQAWTSSSTTAATLLFFTTCLLVSLLADTRFCMRIVWFLAGMYFFFCWPVASLYPQYRLLVYPIRWVFWNIPTKTEWSLFYLQEHVAMLHGSGTLDESVNGPRKNDSATFSTRNFDASLNGAAGHLLTGERYLSFVPLGTDPHHNRRLRATWSCRYAEILEMEKQEISRRGKLAHLDPACEALVLRTVAGGTQQIDIARGRRDEVFNLIVGLSGKENVRWKPMRMDRKRLG